MRFSSGRRSALTVVAIIGTLTALFAATIGMAQTDIKKVLAYSTVSQLGYMFMACGVGGIFRRHFSSDDACVLQRPAVPRGGLGDSRYGRRAGHAQMGGLRKRMPWTFWTMTTATFAIAGIPPFAGFFSKDEILWQAYQAHVDLLVDWIVHGVSYFLLYVPALVYDILWRISRGSCRSTM